jgi:hypothetical protein
MKDHGITPINWTTVAAELQRNWSLPTGKAHAAAALKLGGRNPEILRKIKLNKARTA